MQLQKLKKSLKTTTAAILMSNLSIPKKAESWVAAHAVTR
jgi:hypothetical protein